MVRHPYVRRVLATVAFAFLFTVFVQLPATAQTTTTAQANGVPRTTTGEPDRWTVTAFLGPGFGGGLQGNAMDLGVAAGYNWTDRVGFEGEFGYAREGSNELVNVTSNTETFSANALYQVPYKSWLPYGTFGIGAIHGGANVVVPGQVGEFGQSTTNFQFNLGAGVKRALSSSVRFRADLRFFDSGADLPNFWRIYGGLTFLLGQR